MNKRARQVLAVLLIAEGALVALLGRGYLCLWVRLLKRTSLADVLRSLARNVGWAWRPVGVAEVSVGMALLRGAPPSPERFYGAWAGLYRRIATAWRDVGYRAAFQAYADELVARLRPDTRVLDLGCGTGENLDHLLALHLPFDAYLGLDVSAAMLRQARQRFAASPHISFAQVDLLAEPWPARTYDLILATWLMEHLPAPAHLVGHALAHLRPGGQMIIVSELHDGSWRARVMDWGLGAIGARLPHEDDYDTLPGLESLRRFPGVFAPVVVAVIERPLDA